MQMTCACLQLYQVALKDNRTIMRLAANMHHKLSMRDLAHATIQDTMEAMQASECVVLLRWLSSADTLSKGKQGEAEEDISKMKLRKFSLLDGRLEEDVVQWNDAVIEQSLLRGMLVNVTSQRMLNALGYKRLHKLSAISGSKKLQSQVERDPDELFLGPTMCCPLFTGLDRGQVFGAIQIRRRNRAALFAESDEQKFRYFCQHASSAFRRTFERERLVDMIEKHEDNAARNGALCGFLEKIHDSTDIAAIRRHIVSASKALALCSAVNFYTVEKDQTDAAGHQEVVSTPDAQVAQHFETEIRMGSENHVKKFSLDLGIPGEVRRQGGYVIVNNPADSAFFDKEIDDPGDGGSCRNALGVPVYSRTGTEEVVAVVVLFNAFAKSEHGLGDRNFDQEDTGKF